MPVITENLKKKKKPKKYQLQSYSKVFPLVFVQRVNSFVIHHGNAPSYMSHVVPYWLAENGSTQMAQMLHFPYLPDMTLCDFWAFLKVKEVWKNVHWGSVEEIERVTTPTLKALTQEEFEDCFR